MNLLNTFSGVIPGRHKILTTAVLFCALVVWAPSHGLATSAPESDSNSAPVAQKGIEKQWGIRILGIRRSAADYMLDFRYRVIDAEKAKPLFNRRTQPYLIDQASGAKLVVYSSPKTGPLRSSNVPQAGRNYFIFFANPAKYVKAGNLVTVVIGDFKAENLTVE